MSLYTNPPETEYIDTGEGHVGYQVFGEGPLDIIFSTNIVSNIEAMWTHPVPASYFERLASFSRVVAFDYRGIGVSDPVPLASMPSPDVWSEDAHWVMDAAGMERGAFIGDTEGGPGAIMAATKHPSRVSALVLINSFARFARADDYPIGVPSEMIDRLVEFVDATWGKPDYFRELAPGSRDDAELMDWMARYQKLCVPKGAASKIFGHFVRSNDVRSILPSIQVPTLVVTRRDASYHRPGFGRFLAENIPDAKLVELPGADTAPHFAGDFGAVLDEVEEFLTGVKAAPRAQRRLATVMFTDIVDSTRLAGEMGDQRWLALLQRHDQLKDRYLDRHRGKEIKSVGDGFLALFDSPTHAVECAVELRRVYRSLGLEVRFGIHTGEIEETEHDVLGMAVNIAARICDARPDGGISVSSTVKELTIGSGFEFAFLGARELKGVPGEWALYLVKEEAS